MQSIAFLSFSPFPAAKYSKRNDCSVHAFAGRGNDAIKAYLDRAKHRLDAGVPVAPVALGDEKACNPYLQAKTLEEFMSL